MAESTIVFALTLPALVTAQCSYDSTHADGQEYGVRLWCLFLRQDVLGECNYMLDMFSPV
jgi:hypothetical protein